jgi:type IV pilus assembly protein PilC
MILTTLVWVLVWLLPLAAVCYLVYYGLSLPLLRAERARFFLDLLETGLKQGKNLEQTLISISQSRDTSVGVQFHLLAAHLEKGLRLADALQQVPRLLPPQITTMLSTGSRLGDISKVIPACRKLVADGNSQIQGAMNYFMVIAFTITPIIPVIGGLLMVYVMPKFLEIFMDMGVTTPPLLSLLMHHAWLLFFPLALAVLIFYFLAFLYLGGPPVSMWLRQRCGPLGDRLVVQLPWRRKRLLRDFSAMLAALLDGAVPEAEAVTLAADCTNNGVFQELAKRVVAELRQGATLAEAIAPMDQVGEFRWRLANASHARTGFLQALTAWHDALDAQAFQIEQAAAQGVTTVLVLGNGVLVGILVVAVYQALIAIINEGVLW